MENNILGKEFPQEYGDMPPADFIGYLLSSRKSDNKNFRLSFERLVSEIGVLSGGGAPVYFAGNILPFFDNTGQPITKGAWVILSEGSYTNVAGHPNVVVPANNMGIGQFDGLKWILARSFPLQSGTNGKDGRDISDWEAKVYAYSVGPPKVSFLVFKDGIIWENNSATLATDIPGASAKWVKKTSGEKDIALEWERSQGNLGNYFKKINYDEALTFSNVNYKDFGFWDLSDVEEIAFSNFINTNAGSARPAIYNSAGTLISNIPTALFNGQITIIKKSDYADAKFFRTTYHKDFDQKTFYLAFSSNKNLYQLDYNLYEDKLLNGQGVFSETIPLADFKTEGGYYSSTSGAWMPNAVWKSTNILPLPSDWEGFIGDFVNTNLAGIVLFDKEKRFIMGIGGDNVRMLFKRVNRSELQYATYFALSGSANFARTPIFKLLRKQTLRREDTNPIVTQIANAKIFNPNFQDITEFNTANPTKQIVIDPVFSLDGRPPEKTALRVPAVATTNSGTSLCVMELREQGDDKGAMDLILRRKTTGSSSWTESTVYSNNAITGRAMNPSFVVDRTGAHGVVGRIYLAYLVAKDPTKYVLAQLKSDVDVQLIYSDNDGVSWSSPESLKSNWNTSNALIGFQLTSPSNGIQLTDGTLVFPSMVGAGNVGSYGWRSGIFYKKVGGNWVFPEYALRAASDNECWVVQKPNGKILLNCRVESLPTGMRHSYEFDSEIDKLKIDISDLTFQAKQECEMSAVRITYQSTTFYAMMFPDSLSRRNIAIYLSRDLLSWTRSLLVHKAESRGYTSLSYYNNKLVAMHETGSSTGANFIDLTNCLSKFLTDLNSVFPLNKEESLNDALYASKGWAR